MLDSDINNADAQLHVEFYAREDGPNKGNVYCRIQAPGDKTNVIDQPLRDDHKARFPRQWLYFQMQQNEGAASQIGTPLTQWQSDAPDDINRDQIGELSILKFVTVEQLALASDAQLQRVGMGGIGLREKARMTLIARTAWTLTQSWMRPSSNLQNFKHRWPNSLRHKSAVVGHLKN
jgi:hypothetical protein